MQRHLFDDEDRSALLHRAVVRHWLHSSPCLSIGWTADEEDGVLTCEAAPILQEVLGGVDDGGLVWSAFTFDVTGFATELAVEIKQITFESLCNACCRMPGVSICGGFHGQPFVLRLCQEPISGEPQEGLDAINQRVIPLRQKPL